MKHPKHLLSFLLICFPLIVSSQSVTIKVGEVSGCQPAAIQFSYTTDLPSVTSVLWDFGNSTTSNLDSTKGLYDQVGTYTVTLTLNNTYSTTLTINVSTCLIVPNVFTPNGDTNNDEFIINYNDKDILSFKVFTRSGVMILDLRANKIIWDGKLESGDKVLPGLYYYIIEVKDSSPPILKRGFFYVFY